MRGQDWRIGGQINILPLGLIRLRNFDPASEAGGEEVSASGKGFWHGQVAGASLRVPEAGDREVWVPAAILILEHSPPLAGEDRELSPWWAWWRPNQDSRGQLSDKLTFGLLSGGKRAVIHNSGHKCFVESEWSCFEP